MVDSAAGQARTDRHSTALSAEATVVAVAGILHRRLITGEAPPFIDLLAPLTSLALEPYFHAQEVAEAHEHAQQLARDLTKKHVARHTHPATDTAIPKALTNPRAHRARECLRYLAAHPRAGNRTVADGIGLTRREHATGLLARLADKACSSSRPGNQDTPTPGGSHPTANRSDKYSKTAHKTADTNSRHRIGSLRAAARPGPGAGVGDKDQRSSTRVAAEANAWGAQPPCRATGVADIEKQRQRS
jgi:hypothetical protein